MYLYVYVKVFFLKKIARKENEMKAFVERDIFNGFFNEQSLKVQFILVGVKILYLPTETNIISIATDTKRENVSIRGLSALE